MLFTCYQSSKSGANKTNPIAEWSLARLSPWLVGTITIRRIHSSSHGLLQQILQGGSRVLQNVQDNHRVFRESIHNPWITAIN